MLCFSVFLIFSRFLQYFERLNMWQETDVENMYKQIYFIPPDFFLLHYLKKKSSFNTEEVELIQYLTVPQGPPYPVLAFQRISQDDAVSHLVEEGSCLLISYMLPLNPSFLVEVPSMGHRSVMR